jgi:hypothetical protein
MGHKHKSSPHEVSRSNPDVVVVKRAVLVARVVVQGSFIPPNNVPVRNRWGARNVTGKVLCCELRGIIWRHPEFVVGKFFKMLGKTPTGDERNKLV